MKPRLRFDVLTIFPEIFIYPLKYGVLGKGIEKGIIKVSPRNIRDFAKTPEKKLPVKKRRRK